MEKKKDKDKEKTYEGPEHLKRLKFEPDKIKGFEDAFRKRMGQPVNPKKKR